ncbi:N-acetyltransferase [Novosphingobium marinum]|uniref:RimJ/RimL family protein N-acetyltransferase n=1 Tax=Novosphingobium marinum TaxID=1514948 RepID=A0A7Z0BTY6_9SPHN|nr:GNAT family protein [Novosphingobium marinum]NYH93742.1 RimJ/RimL family protein N-acetyltransferase [Novosphingobium marinum]GGC16962.1 N-acetyltransferase [Novosphingobium marinum]
MNDSTGSDRRLTIAGSPVEFRSMRRGDEDAIRRFAETVPSHDLLFLQRDIRSAKVVDAWLEQIERGYIRSTIAIGDDGIIGCNALVRDDLSWSPHVADIRIISAPGARGEGLGRALAQDCLLGAAEMDLAKLTVRMTPDQDAALKLFEDMGFVPEALLREHVKDADGQSRDILILALDLGKQAAQQRLYGLAENLSPAD